MPQGFPLPEKSLEDRRAFSRDGEDHPLSEREGWLRHLLFSLSIIGLPANIVVHFCENGDEIPLPGDK